MSENAKKEEDSMKAKEESSSSSDSDDSSSDSDNDSDSSDSDDNLVADGTRFKVRVTELNAQLTCSICGGYFRDASTLSECQHTFCKSCILRLFSQGVSNCPEQNCGISLRPKPISKLKPDQKLQTIVNLLVPKVVAEDEAKEKKFFEDSETATVGTSPRSAGDKSKAASLSGGAKKVQKSKEIIRQDQISFEVVPDTSCAKEIQFPKLKSPYLLTSNQLRIGKIRKHVARYLKIEDPQKIELLCKGEPLGSDLTLNYIKVSRWHDAEKNMVLHYRKKTTLF